MARVVLGLFLVGVGWSGSYLAETAQVADAALPDERGRLLGRFDLVAWLAAAVSIVGAGPLMAVAGLEAVAVLCGGFALLGAAIAWLAASRATAWAGASPDPAARS